jgi:hypothetical protein
VSALAAATTLVAAMFGAPIVAAAEQHRCAAWHHPCGTTQTLRSCCCGHAHTLKTPSATETPNPDRSVRPAAVVVAQPALAPSSQPCAALAVRTVPPGSPPDLPTLYAALLI